ncbi:DUF411 domain-containing protein [Stenotrophomonas sp. Marseille-Q5258]|uniref:DUF411 domain-containing protein n=1 Tax=Stenotrophomonas sp. Marseille-Q5258 TaxID=2972779 RepID=UPI0021C5ED0F|nr:DUF411 domain-containing protein [Stenotrophomonas sp. Marseille-Q5258]
MQHLRLLRLVAFAGASLALAACAQPPAPTTAAPAAADAQSAAAPVSPAGHMVVHKSASCGCCGIWVDHVRRAGFSVEVRDTDDLMTVKQRLGVPLDKAACHTAEVGPYIVEGHIPATDIQRLLRERLLARGLLLPGMPAGSPGMEVPGMPVPGYTVELLGRDGRTTPFSRHGRAPDET